MEEATANGGLGGVSSSSAATNSKWSPAVSYHQERTSEREGSGCRSLLHKEEEEMSTPRVPVVSRVCEEEGATTG